MTKKPRKPRDLRAFSLLELSISIAIISIILGGAAVVLTKKIEDSQATENAERMDEIATAIISFQERTGYLPCPASLTVVPGNASFGREVNSGDCTYTSAPAGTSRIETSGGSGVYMVRGALPVYDLQLPATYAEDVYGNRYTYSVMQLLAESATYSAGAGAIVVKNRQGNNIITDGAFIVVSHGKEGEGAYRAKTGAQKAACGSTTLDSDNCDADVTFVEGILNDQVTGASYYSDTIRWRSKTSL